MAISVFGNDSVLALLGKFLATFKEFPPSQTPGSFSLDNVMEALSKPSGSN